MEKRRELPRAAEFYSLPVDGRLGSPIQSDELFSELMNAVMGLRRAMMKAGFEPPKSIELASHEDGFKLRHILPREMVAAYASEALRDENATDVAFTLCGVEFRYPAHFRRVGKGLETL